MKRKTGLKKKNKGPYQHNRMVSTLLETGKSKNTKRERFAYPLLQLTKAKNSPSLTGSTGLDSAQATANLGRQLIIQKLPRLWLLRGELGAGKTTLIRGALRGLGVRQRVTSPTFTLKKIYLLHRRPWRQAVHIDAYRIKSQQELSALDVASALADKKTILFIEWPEKIKQKFVGPVTSIHLRHRGRGRQITVAVR